MGAEATKPKWNVLEVARLVRDFEVAATRRAEGEGGRDTRKSNRAADRMLRIAEILDERGAIGELTRFLGATNPAARQWSAELILMARDRERERDAVATLEMLARSDVAWERMSAGDTLDLYRKGELRALRARRGPRRRVAG